MNGPAGALPPFELARKVEASDLDELAHVNNVVYLRWVQEIATAHWLAIAPPDDVAAIAWVARRHEIDYLSPAVLGDNLVVRTRVGVAQGLTFERLTEIVRSPGDVPVLKARTLWVPIDRRTGKPCRVGASVRNLFSVPA